MMAFFNTSNTAAVSWSPNPIAIASVLEIDEVIDPAETRHWIMAGLRSVPKPEPRQHRKRPCIDAW